MTFIHQKLTKLYFKLKPLFFNKKILIISFLVSFGLLLPRISQAAWGLGKTLGGIFYIFGMFMYTLTTAIFAPILGWAVNGTNNFLQDPVVTEGWSVVRDTANMFFILILLFIAFATILRIEAYTYRRMLVPMIIAILLVNFSRTICGIIVDFSDTLMKGFIGGLTGGGAENIPVALLHNAGLHDLLRASFDKVSKTATHWEDVKSIMFIAAYVTVFTISLIAVSIFLIVRTLALAFLTIASPLVFAFQIIPAAKTFTGKWWPAFIKYALYGPVAVFCIMLAAKLAPMVLTIDPDEEAFISQVSTPTKVLQGLFVIGILFASVKAAQTLGIHGAEAITKFAKAAGTFAPRQLGRFAAARVPTVGRRAMAAMGRIGVEEGRAPAAIKRFRKRAEERGRMARESKIVTGMRKGISAIRGALGPKWEGAVSDEQKNIDALTDAEKAPDAMAGRMKDQVKVGVGKAKPQALASMANLLATPEGQKEYANLVANTPEFQKYVDPKLRGKGFSEEANRSFMKNFFAEKAPEAMALSNRVSKKSGNMLFANATRYNSATRKSEPVDIKEQARRTIDELLSKEPKDIRDQNKGMTSDLVITARIDPKTGARKVKGATQFTIQMLTKKENLERLTPEFGAALPPEVRRSLLDLRDKKPKKYNKLRDKADGLGLVDRFNTFFEGLEHPEHYPVT